MYIVISHFKGTLYISYLDSQYYKRQMLVISSSGASASGASDGPPERMFLQDHSYSTFKWQVEHPYACSGARWENDLDPIQDELVNIVFI